MLSANHLIKIEADTMSAKKNSLNTSGNTLFNYFSRSPSTPQSKKPTASPAASPFASKPSTPTSSKMGKSGMYSSYLNIIFSQSFD